MLINSGFVIWLIVLLVLGGPSDCSFNQPQFSPCASWNSDAITFANYSVNGSAPFTVFVDTNNTVYAAFQGRNQVLVWLEGSMTITRNISGGLQAPWGLFVTDNGDVYVDNGATNHRVDKWIVNTTNSVAVMNVTSDCFSLFVDINYTLYCSFNYGHKVVKMSLNNDSNMTIIAAGNGTAGLGPYMLNSPNGIFVDDSFNLYVADCKNNRIQLFQSGQLNGSTVAVNGAYGTIILRCPTGIMLDGDGYIFIVDYNNNRIVSSGSTGFRCLVGCSGSGSAPNQLQNPRSLAFDSYGNIFVADMSNGRIQKFFLASNSCVVSYNQPKFSSCASWNPDAITFTNITLIKPQGVFVNTNNMVYVTITNLSELLVWSATANTPIRNYSSGLNQPYGLFITNDDAIYVDNGAVYHQVYNWMWNGTSRVAVKNVNNTCFGLFIDINDTLYCSNYLQHKVTKVSLNNSSNTMIIAAGNGTAGLAPYMLNTPSGIFIDEYFNLYVADYGNNRIQFFQFEQLNATTIVGNGTTTITLNGPTGIVLDADSHLFIVDSNNHRIIGSNSTGFQCLIGCYGQGSASDQLNQPQSISFDSYGNIFVTDMNNNRIQKFILASNYCDETTTSLQMLTPNINIVETSTNNIQSTSVLTITLSTILTTEFDKINITTAVATKNSTTSMNTTPIQQLSQIFVPPSCSNSTNIGSNCNISNTACAMLEPCQNNSTCTNIDTSSYDYFCSCLPGFNGTQCQFDYRPCKSNTCWNNGICNETSNTTFICLCKPGWNGIHCEIQINYCQNVLCNNNGICRPLFLNYTCECFTNSYTGRHCEISTQTLIVHKTVSKTFAFVAIISLISVAMFIVVMDVLKYWFGIDLTNVESKQIQKKKQVKKYKSPVIVRFTYVNSSASISPRKTISAIREAVV